MRKYPSNITREEFELIRKELEEHEKEQSPEK